jgi:bacteriocin biosynthesis cyclodehydratase domain-containing protein
VGSNGSVNGNGTDKLVVNPYLTIGHCGSNEVFVKQGRRSRFSRVIRDEGRTRLLGKLLRGMAEPASLHDLEQRELVAGSEAGEARRLLDYLVKERILIPPQDYLPHVYLSMLFGDATAEALASRTVGLIGGGPLGARLAREFARVRVKGVVVLDDRRAAAADRDYFDLEPSRVKPGTPYTEAVRSSLEAYDYDGVRAIDAPPSDSKALETLFSKCDFVVTALEAFSPTMLHVANEIALAQGKPWMSAYVDGCEALIGPLYVAGETLCYNEFEIQNEASTRLQADYLLYKETIAQDGVGARHLVMPPVLSMMSGWIATAALQFLVTQRSFVVGRCVRIDLERLAVDYQDVLRLPRCPACAAQRPSYRHTLL